MLGDINTSLSTPYFQGDTAVTTNESNNKKTFSQIWEESSVEKKVGIVAGFVFLTIPVCIYHAIKDGVPALAQWSIKAVEKMARWTNENVLSPLMQKVESVGLSIFNAARNVVRKIAHQVVVLHSMYKRMEAAIERAIEKVAFAIYHSSKQVYEGMVYSVEKINEGIVWTKVNILDAVALTIKQKAVELFNEVLKPFGAWAYKTILEPVFKAVSDATRAVFITMPKIVYDRALVPAYEMVIRGKDWTHNHVIIPVIKAISDASQAVFVTMPKMVYDHALVPAYEMGLRGKVWTHEQVIIPVIKAISDASQAVFVTMPKMIYDQALVPACETVVKGKVWTHEQVITPVYKGVQEFATETIPAAFRAIESKVYA